MLDEFVEWLKVQRGEGSLTSSIETRGSWKHPSYENNDTNNVKKK